MTNYLSLPAIAEFVNAYEEKPTAENVKIMVSGLLTYAFDSKDGWLLKWEDDQENRHSICFVVKATGEARALHAVVKIVLDKSAPIEETWDQSIPRLIGAPITGGRCWAILIRGLKVRLYEYHRDENPDYRLLPCDFKVKDKLKQTVHIRKNADSVNQILTGIPGQAPKPLDECEHNSLAVNEPAVDETNELKSSADGNLPTIFVSKAHVKSSSEDRPTEASEDKTPTETEPVAEPKAAAQTKTATQVDTATAQIKNTTATNGIQANITPQAKAVLLPKAATGAKSATQVKPATGAKSATQAKANLLAKGVSGIKLTPKPKSALRTEIVGQTATN
ncbi:uncharacterized protein N7479_000900 [Penicillium vulpinum]|uniref:Uncharacterized protein n=1 Tax=Penicillium vulpinum TaxID=29845 RepID=A0A1V6S6Z7_9EURO|nr:uncharacterized protein N7479_000900 [Penicillium vulpinum]KAJ5970982.1 hypothetical protein N7479_000900 [Penicillium vulpinum]OQE09638.1 hypothetical protein PENVUL_c006G03707 [Penicillium vulpinum]